MPSRGGGVLEEVAELLPLFGREIALVSKHPTQESARAAGQSCARQASVESPRVEEHRQSQVLRSTLGLTGSLKGV